MNVVLDMIVPPGFFTGRENGLTMSEEDAKLVLETVFENIVLQKGDPEKREPDFIDSSDGYEIRLAVADALILHLKGFTEPGSIFESQLNLEDVIKNAVEEKAKKVKKGLYDRKISIFIFAIDPKPSWYGVSFQNGMVLTIFHKEYPKTRNDLFKFLFDNYISNEKVFKNIYILQPTINGTYRFYDIAAYASNQDYDTEIEFNETNWRKFPIFSYVSSDTQSGEAAYTINPIINVQEDENGQI